MYEEKRKDFENFKPRKLNRSARDLYGQEYAG